MTQSNDPSGSKAPGFGAFIGSDSSDNSASKTSTTGAKPRRKRSTTRATTGGDEGGRDGGSARESSADEGTSRTGTRGGQRKKATRRRASAADRQEGESTDGQSTDGRSTDNRSEREDASERKPRARRSRKPASETSEVTEASTDSDDSERGGRSRGMRTRRRGTSETKAETTDAGSEVEQDASETRGEGRSRGRGSRGGRRRGGRSREAGEESGEQDAEREDTREEVAADSEQATEKPRRKRSRGGRGRSRKKSTETEVSAEADEPETEDEGGEESSSRRTKAPRRRRSTRAASSEEESQDSERTEDESSESDDDKPKRRRRGSRGSRGGRGRTKKVAGRREKPGAAVVEFIPGEEDDLPELPELPDDAELLNEDELEEGGSSRKKRTRRKRGETADVDDQRVAAKAAKITPDRKILVNAIDKEETRVAVVCNGKILDFQMNVESDTSLVNDIYRGRIVNIEHSIGAAFVDFGRGRNGFLHTSDVLPTYADAGASLSKLLSTSVDPEDWDESSSQPGVTAELGDDEDDEDSEGEAEGDESSSSKKTGRRKRATKGKGRNEKGRQKRFRARPRTPIDALFKVGQKVVVQITKDAIGDKGPTLTTYLSIPGRYLVLMPSISHSGVSRKIEDSKERKRLKRILDSLNVPEGMGVIARTATMGHTKMEIKRDLDYLLSAWNQLSKRLEQGHGPAALYQESDVAIRTVRDLFGPETEAVIVDEPEAYKSIHDFAELLMPEHADRIVMHDGKRPLFHAEGVEQDFEKIFSRRIELPSGGSIVFDQAEALVAIDVNSGKTRTASHDFEEIALKTNMEAVPEIARQIRLRDLGGIIVCDFIDMMKNSNRKAVEQTFRGRFSDDRARSKVGRISQFGLLEMTRQRLGPGMSKKLFKPCVACRGAGRQRTESSRAAAILRRLGSALTLKGFTTVELKAHPETIEYLKTVRAKELRALEESSGRNLELKPVPDQIEDSVLRYLRTDGREVRPGGRRKR